VEGDAPKDEWIYRAMYDDKGKPKLGSSASTLGIRPGVDIEVDANGMVHRPTFRPKQKNGLSCAPSVQEVPYFARPIRFGGGNNKTDVWRISKSDLGSALVAQQDGPHHVSVGPATTMPIGDYIRAIQGTASYWHKII
jgi:hypothetical protein